MIQYEAGQPGLQLGTRISYQRTVNIVLNLNMLEIHLLRLKCNNKGRNKRLNCL